MTNKERLRDLEQKVIALTAQVKALEARLDSQRTASESRASSVPVYVPQFNQWPGAGA